MSNLSNLMISGSYKGLINLVDSTLPLSGQSVTLVDLQDGLGNDVGIQINKDNNAVTITNGFIVSGSTNLEDNLTVSGSVDISGSLRVHGNKEITGSVNIKGDVNVDGDITADTGSFDTINTRVLNVTIETASVIFSSGSNVLGDEITDRQDLIGQVVVSGSLGVEGNSAFTGSLTVSNEISSSTVNGIGNVTTYSSSVDDRLVQLEINSGSQASQLSNLENFTASQENINSGYNSFTSSYYTDSASFDDRIDQLEAETGSQVQRLNSLEAFSGSQETLNGFYNSFTASNGNDSLNDFTSSQLSINGFYNSFTASNGNTSLNQYTSSTDSRLNNIEAFTSSLQTDFVTTGSFNAYTSSTDNTIATLATTGSNTFIGNNTFNGSVNGDVVSLTITSQTASIDCSQGNFFTLTLPDSSTDTHLVATNIQAGQTSNVRINTTGSGSVTFSSDFQFPVLNSYIASATNTTDILTFVTFDTSLLYGVAVKRLG